MIIPLNVKKGESGTRTIDLASVNELVRPFFETAVKVLISIDGDQSKSINSYFYGLRDFFRWLEESELPLWEKMCNGEFATEGVWKMALYKYQEYLKRNYRPKTIKSKLLNLNSTLKKLARRGVVAKFRGAPVKIDRDVAGRQGDKNAKGNKQHNIQKHLKRALISMPEIKSTEVTQILGLFESKEAIHADNELSRTKVINSVAKAIDAELTQLKDTAEKIYSECKEKLDNGKLIETSRSLSDKLIELATEFSVQTERDGKISYTASRTIEKSFTSEFAEKDYTSALVSYVKYHADGLWPRTDNPIGGAISERIFPIVGGKNVYGLLHPTPEFIAANVILLTLQTALNRDSVLMLKEDCIETDSRGNARGLFYYKKRSDKDDSGQEAAKPLRGTRRSYKYSTHQIISNYQAISSAYRQYAEYDYLFLSVPRLSDGVINERAKQPQLYSQSAISRSAKAIFEQAGLVLSGVDDIRKRVLLLTALESGTFAAIAEADHKNMGSIKHYVDSDVITFQAEGKLKAFQSAYELAIQKDADAFLRALGIPSDKRAEAIQKMSDSGLGTVCLDKKYNPVTKQKSKQDCDAIENCMACKQFKPLIILEVNNICRLIAFNEHLKASEDQCRLHSEKLWESKWQPWLYFTTAALVLIDSPIHFKIKKQATKLYQSNKPVMPDLW